jgi:hypothetical protein
MFPPPERTLVLLAAVPKLIPFTPAVVLTTGPVGLEVPAAPPPKMMFPVAMETAASQLALVFMHTELPKEMDPLPPEELAQSTRSDPAVCKVRFAATEMEDCAFTIKGSVAELVRRLALMVAEPPDVNSTPLTDDKAAP